jgi:hypothetical protein
MRITSVPVHAAGSPGSRHGAHDRLCGLALLFSSSIASNGGRTLSVAAEQAPAVPPLKFDGR